MKREYRVVTFFVSFFLTLVVLGLFVCPIKIDAQNISQTCNSTGILIRSDGSVVLDTWKDYSGVRNPMPPAPGIPSMPVNFQAADLPSTITLGKSLSDKVKICIESDSGSHCVLLEQVRKVK